MSEAGYPESQPALATSWKSAIERLEGAYSPHTLRAYRADFAKFETWCLAHGDVATPASPESVASFIAADAKTSASATLRRRLAGIRKVHRLLRLPSPVDDEEVAIALRRALRTKRRRPRQARPVTAGIRDAMIAACPNDLRGLRDRAIIAVGYDTLCRRSELVELLIQDLHVNEATAKVLVRRTKNDPFADGRWAYLSPTAFTHLNVWLADATIDQGPIFRPIKGLVVGSFALHPVAIGRVLRLAAERAGIPSDLKGLFSGHSLRVGAAQDLLVSGFDLLSIMTAGRWTSSAVVARYVSNADLNIWNSRKSRDR